MKNLLYRFSGLLAALLLTLGFTHAAERFDRTINEHVVFEADSVPAPMCAAPCTSTGDDGAGGSSNEGND